MTGSRYECVCTTCDTSEVFGDLRRAQEHFNEHAVQGCEVVLRNVTPSSDRVTTRSDASADESPPVEE